MKVSSILCIYLRLKTYSMHFNKKRAETAERRKLRNKDSQNIIAARLRMSWTIRRRHVTWNFVPRERELSDSYRFSDTSRGAVDPPGVWLYESHAHTHGCMRKRRASCTYGCTDTTAFVSLAKDGWTDSACSWACWLDIWLGAQEERARWTRAPPVRDNTWWDSAITVNLVKRNVNENDATFMYPRMMIVRI